MENKNEYSIFMQQFFKEIDSSNEKNPEKLVEDFANYCLLKEERFNNIQKHSTVNELQNVSVLAKDTSLEFLTKRVSLIADTSIFAHFGETEHNFFTYYDRDGTFRVQTDHKKAYIACHNIGELGKWLKECKPLLLRGDVFYLPDIRIRQVFFSGYSGSPRETATISSKDLLLDAIVNNKKLVEQPEYNQNIPQIISKLSKSILLKPILSIDLPYIEGVNFSTFVKITSDENEAFQNFRDFLRLKFLDMKQGESSEFFDSSLMKASIEIKEGVRNLNSEFNRLKRTKAFESTKGMIVATSVVLVAVNSGFLSALPVLLGTGGLMSLINSEKVILDEKHKLENNPYYYLWLISKKNKTNIYS